MSEHALAQEQRTNTPQEAARDALSLQHRHTNQAEPTTLPRLLFDVAPGTFTEPRFGYDFSLVPAHTDIVQRAQPLLRTGTMVQRHPANGDADSAQHATFSDEESTPVSAPAEPTVEPAPSSPESAPTPATTEPEEESAAAEETTAPALLVEDSATELAPGQMRKSEFLAQLRAEVTRAAESAMAGTGRTTADCPYLDYWFGYYSLRDSAHIERAIHRYAPVTRSAASLGEYITIITGRVRRSVETWVRTGEVTGVPEGLPGMGLLGSIDSLVSGIGSIFRKARNGSARKSEDPRVIQAQLGSGRPLDSAVRSRMESAFGRDFSHVRTHTDTTAVGLSNRLNARAFTVGEHVAFGSGEYRPGTLVGDALIAHEMVHVVQQSGASASVAPMKASDTDYNALEGDADKTAAGAVASLWSGTKDKLVDISQNVIPNLRSGLRLQRCDKDSGSKKPPGTPSSSVGIKATCVAASACEPGKHVKPNFKVNKPPPKRSNTASSTIATKDPTFTGEACADCSSKVWHYQINSVESKATIQIVYYTSDHYPAPTPADDSGPLTNVNETNWEAIIEDLKDNKDGIPDFWSAYKAEDLHEDYHWKVEWQGEVKKELVKAENDIAKLTLDFSKASTASEAGKVLLPDAQDTFNDAMNRARSTYDALPDEPSDPPYKAQVPAIESMIKRVKEYAKSKKW
jgi:hypothetical protein